MDKVRVLECTQKSNCNVERVVAVLDTAAWAHHGTQHGLWMMLDLLAVWGSIWITHHNKKPILACGQLSKFARQAHHGQNHHGPSTQGTSRAVKLMLIITSRAKGQ